MNSSVLRQFIEKVWQTSIVERLQAYIRIPNKSPAFDPDWQRHGYMDQAIELMAQWCRAQAVPRMSVEVRRLPGMTPLLMVDIPGELPECVLLYGHLDKQPEFTGWHEGLSPWEPVIRDGRLYGRGAADDGYAVFSSLTAIAALQAQHIAHARCVVLIEACVFRGDYSMLEIGRNLAERNEFVAFVIGSVVNPSLEAALEVNCG